MSSPLRPDPLGPGGTRSEQETAEGEVHTSHCMFLNSFAVDEPEFVHMAMPIDMEEFCNQSGASGDEVGLALIDTACTACMHSMSWRLAFSRRLPDMVKCEPSQQFKTFHFANGSSTASQIQVWKIPICLGGRPGEVHSAEVPEGNTPLLLSISALDALDAVVFMRKKLIRLQELGVTLPLFSTRTKHLAIDVSFENLELDATSTLSGQPMIKSQAEDLSVFWAEEANESILQEFVAFKVVAAEFSEETYKPKVGSRGVTTKDRRKSLHVARFEALQQAAVTVTRLASLSRGWVNSQPMDVKDGVDLLSAERHWTAMENTWWAWSPSHLDCLRLPTLVNTHQLEPTHRLALLASDSWEKDFGVSEGDCQTPAWARQILPAREPSRSFVLDLLRHLDELVGGGRWKVCRRRSMQIWQNRLTHRQTCQEEDRMVGKQRAYSQPFSKTVQLPTRQSWANRWSQPLQGSSSLSQAALWGNPTWPWGQHD